MFKEKNKIDKTIKVVNTLQIIVLYLFAPSFLMIANKTNKNIFYIIAIIMVIISISLQIFSNRLNKIKPQ
jgi:uncharacterized membrane protein YqjE